MSAAVRWGGKASAARWVGLAIAAGAIALLAMTVDIGATVAIVANADARMLVPLLPVLAAQLLLRGERWRRLLAATGHQIARRRVLPVLLIGYLGNIALPARAGELIRTVLLSARETIPGGTVFATVVVERVLDTLTLGVLGLAAALAVLADTSGSQLIALGAIAVAASMGVLGASKWLAPRVEGRARVEGSGHAVRTAVANFAGAIAQIGYGPLIVAGALSTLAWFGDALLFWLSARSVNLDVSLAQAFVIAAVAVLATAIPSAPAYVGTFELAAVAAGSALGLPSELVLATATLAHLIVILTMSIAGAVSAVWIGFRFGSGTNQLHEVVGEMNDRHGPLGGSGQA